MASEMKDPNKQARRAVQAALEDIGAVQPEPRASLHRLKRWIGKEAARCSRIAKAAHEHADYTGLERARGEENVLRMVMGKIDTMLRPDE